MNILLDEWTPLFEDLAERVSSGGRQRLMFQLIGDVYDVTVLNFTEPSGRPVDWQDLSPLYAMAEHGGDTTPTLILTGAMRAGFEVEFDANSGALTNSVEYTDEHQFGEPGRNLPARPFYPVDESGLNLTPYMESRLLGIMDSHFQV